jgi:hypothetical protein
MPDIWMAVNWGKQAGFERRPRVIISLSTSRFLACSDMIAVVTDFDLHPE